MVIVLDRNFSHLRVQTRAPQRAAAPGPAMQAACYVGGHHFASVYISLIR